MYFTTTIKHKDKVFMKGTQVEECGCMVLDTGEWSASGLGLGSKGKGRGKAKVHSRTGHEGPQGK